MVWYQKLNRVRGEWKSFLCSSCVLLLYSPCWMYLVFFSFLFAACCLKIQNGGLNGQHIKLDGWCNAQSYKNQYSSTKIPTFSSWDPAQKKRFNFSFFLFLKGKVFFLCFMMGKASSNNQQHACIIVVFPKSKKSLPDERTKQQMPALRVA
jgi:hypothetical protein